MYKGPLDERYILHNLGVDPVKLAFEMALSVRKKKKSHCILILNSFINIYISNQAQKQQVISKMPKGQNISVAFIKHYFSIFLAFSKCFDCRLNINKN